MLIAPPFRRFLGMGGGPREGSRSAAAGGPSANSRRPCDVPPLPPPALLALIPSFGEAPPPAPAIFGKLTPPPICFNAGCWETGAFGARFAVARWTGRFLGAARFDVGRAERFDFTAALVRDFVFDFGRAERTDDFRATEARFFIFLGRRDLDLLLERFPAMNRSFRGEKPNSIS